MLAFSVDNPGSGCPVPPAQVDELIAEAENRKEAYGLLVAALKAESPESHLAFTVRVACGLTYAEIARGLGLGSARSAQRLVDAAMDFLRSRRP